MPPLTEGTSGYTGHPEFPDAIPSTRRESFRLVGTAMTAAVFAELAIPRVVESAERFTPVELLDATGLPFLDDAKRCDVALGRGAGVARLDFFPVPTDDDRTIIIYAVIHSKLDGFVANPEEEEIVIRLLVNENLISTVVAVDRLAPIPFCGVDAQIEATSEVDGVDCGPMPATIVALNLEGKVKFVFCLGDEWKEKELDLPDKSVVGIMPFLENKHLVITHNQITAVPETEDVELGNGGEKLASLQIADLIAKGQTPEKMNGQANGSLHILKNTYSGMTLEEIMFDEQFDFSSVSIVQTEGYPPQPLLVCSDVTNHKVRVFRVNMTDYSTQEMEPCPSLSGERTKANGAWATSIQGYSSDAAYTLGTAEFNQDGTVKTDYQVEVQLEHGDHMYLLGSAEVDGERLVYIKQSNRYGGMDIVAYDRAGGKIMLGVAPRVSDEGEKLFQIKAGEHPALVIAEDGGYKIHQLQLLTFVPSVEDDQ
jgi:hypothetical protein